MNHHYMHVFLHANRIDPDYSTSEDDFQGEERFLLHQTQALILNIIVCWRGKFPEASVIVFCRSTC